MVNSKQVIKKIVKGNYQFISRRWKVISSEAKKLVVRLLMHDPNRRPTAAQALDDPWFTSGFDNQGFSPEVALMVSCLIIIIETPRRLRVLTVCVSTTKDKVQATIQTFAGDGKLKKLALMLIAYRSSTEEIGYLRKMFETFDGKHDG